jgi:NodT family efflux transporter outer membrane factor (OMF) lipoprotein
MRTFEQRLEYARRNVEIQKGSLQLAEDRYERGVATELDVRQARSSLAQIEAAVYPLEVGRRQASNRLCTLLGMPVGDLAPQLGPAPIPRVPVEVAVGIPADLLRRRPDIRRAERQVAAQSARIGVAEADLYPSLTLNGFLGYAADDIERLFRSNSFLGFIVPTLQWNILNYGRIANNIRSQDARLEVAALEYQQTVLTAGREVEDALVAFLRTQQQAARLEVSVQEAERSVELVLIQFRGGVTDFNRVFNTQAVLVSQQDQLAVARGEIAQNLIRVYKALGGGWQYFYRGCGMPRMHAPETVPAETVPVETVPPETVPGGDAVEQERVAPGGAEDAAPNGARPDGARSPASPQALPPVVPNGPPREELPPNPPANNGSAEPH